MNNQVKVTRVADANTRAGQSVIIYRVEFAGEFIGTVQRYTQCKPLHPWDTAGIHFVSIGTDDITMWEGTGTRKAAVQRLVDQHLGIPAPYRTRYNGLICRECPSEHRPYSYDPTRKPHNPVHEAYLNGYLTPAA